MRPRVTVGMPVRNGEPYLAEALDAILGQTLREIELVIADNASSDGTERLVRERARRDPRVRFIRSDVNLGAAANYNRVLALARSPYFKWAASDDLIAPTFLERALEALEGDPGAVLAFPRPESFGLRLMARFAETAPALHRNSIVMVPPGLKYATREKLVGQGCVVVTRPVDFTTLRSMLLRIMPMESLPVEAEAVDAEPLGDSEG